MKKIPAGGNFFAKVRGKPSNRDFLNSALRRPPSPLLLTLIFVFLFNYSKK